MKVRTGWIYLLFETNLLTKQAKDEMDHFSKIDIFYHFIYLSGHKGKKARFTKFCKYDRKC